MPSSTYSHVQSRTTYVSSHTWLCGRGLEFHPAIPILQKHLEFLVERYEHYAEVGGRPDELEELFSPEWMHEAMSKVVAQGSGHLSKVRFFA